MQNGCSGIRIVGARITHTHTKCINSQRKALERDSNEEAGTAENKEKNYGFSEFHLSDCKSNIMCNEIPLSTNFAFRLRPAMALPPEEKLAEKVSTILDLSVTGHAR